MAKYKAKERGYIGRIVEEGEVFDFDGKPGNWMEPVTAEDKPAKAEKPAKADKPTDK